MFLFRGKESHSRSLTKAISWRILGSIDTFLLSLLFTSDFTKAGAIAGSEVLTKMVLYYLHERAWARFSWGIHAKESQTPEPTTPEQPLEEKVQI